MQNKITSLSHSLKNYKYIIFDLDNTIYDFRDYDYGAMKEVFKLLKIKIYKPELIKFINYRQKNLYKKNLIDNFLGKINIQKNLIKKSILTFKNHNCKYIKSQKSLRGLLKRLKEKKKILFIVSNGEINRQNKKLNKLKIKKYFKKIIICSSKKNKLKPNKFGFEKIYKKTMNLKEFVMIGDSKIDKRFAKNCRIKFIKFKYINTNYEKTRFI